MFRYFLYVDVREPVKLMVPSRLTGTDRGLKNAVGVWDRFFEKNISATVKKRFAFGVRESYFSHAVSLEIW
jgi:hypothetical protein